MSAHHLAALRVAERQLRDEQARSGGDGARVVDPVGDRERAPLARIAEQLAGDAAQGLALADEPQPRVVRGLALYLLGLELDAAELVERDLHACADRRAVGQEHDEALARPG